MFPNGMFPSMPSMPGIGTCDGIASEKPCDGGIGMFVAPQLDAAAGAAFDAKGIGSELSGGGMPFMGARGIGLVPTRGCGRDVG